MVTTKILRRDWTLVKLDANGLNQVLQSVDRRIAHETQSLFHNDSLWEAASLSELESWISGNTATDPGNNRTVND